MASTLNVGTKQQQQKQQQQKQQQQQGPLRLSNDQYAQARKLYGIFDHDGDNKVSIGDMAKVMKRETKDPVMLKFMYYLDRDNSRSVSFVELIKGLEAFAVYYGVVPDLSTPEQLSKSLGTIIKSKPSPMAIIEEPAAVVAAPIAQPLKASPPPAAPVTVVAPVAKKAVEVVVATPTPTPKEEGAWTVEFSLEYVTKFGEELYMVGDTPQLGEWKMEISNRMQWTPGHIWRYRMTIPVGTKFNYKYAAAHLSSIGRRYEDGVNRVWNRTCDDVYAGPALKAGNVVLIRDYFNHQPVLSS